MLYVYEIMIKVKNAHFNINKFTWNSLVQMKIKWVNRVPFAKCEITKWIGFYGSRNLKQFSVNFQNWIMFDEYPELIQNSNHPHCTISTFLHRIAFTVLHTSLYIQRVGLLLFLYLFPYPMKRDKNYFVGFRVESDLGITFFWNWNG